MSLSAATRFQRETLARGRARVSGRGPWEETVSTKSTIEYSEDFHLYIDWADDLSGPHGYLRIDNGLVKELYTRQHRGGLSITLRLPPEIYPVLRTDIARVLRRRSEPLDSKEMDRAIAPLRGLAGSKRRGTHVADRKGLRKQGRHRPSGPQARVASKS